MSRLSAVTAYRKAASHRSSREQEAEVFSHVNAGLRRSAKGSPEAARALADNERLWITVMDVLNDPSNRLPENTRAGLLSIGHTVRRELKTAQPDLAFLITINEQISSGLAGS